MWMNNNLLIGLTDALEKAIQHYHSLQVILFFVFLWCYWEE